MKKVLVIGAAGRTGLPLVRQLAARGAEVVALIRSAERERAVLDAGAAAARLADLNDPSAIRTALSDIEIVHFIPPPLNPSEIAYAENAIAEAERSNVWRFVYHSVLHPYTTAMPHHLRKARVEERLRDSTLDWTILQPAMYAQTVALYFRPPSVLLAPFNPSRRFSLIDSQDLAEASANVILNEDHTFASYELAGPEQLSFYDVADRLGEIVGCDVAVTPIPASELGLPPQLGARALAEAFAMFAHYDAHGLKGNSGQLERLLDRPPTRFKDAFRPVAELLSRS